MAEDQQDLQMHHLEHHPEARPLPSADLAGATGSCACGALTYTLTAAPLIIHCCHCTACQVETGSAFAINILLEAENVHLNSAESSTSPTAPRAVSTVLPSASGRGQLLTRCSACGTTVWSNYAGSGPLVRFVRAGTLHPSFKPRVQPDVHIYTRSRLPWIRGPDSAQEFEGFYDQDKVWRPDSLERRKRLAEEVKRWREENPDGFGTGKVQVLNDDGGAVDELMEGVRKL